MKKICVLFLLYSGLHFGQNLTPLEKSNFMKLTSYNELVSYLQTAVANSKYLSIDTLAVSVEGRNIPFVKISKNNFASDKKLRVLIFAQQHGNEHSSKEGGLLLIKEFANGKLNYLLERLDILIVPQMNPDGSEKNQRMNGSGMDLNRNHEILTAPEVLGLHKLFNKYLPQATIDVHEYYPYSEEWVKAGYRRDWDETVGTLTNPNASVIIKKFEKEKYLPFIKNYLSKNGFSFHEYVVGGPPNLERMRFSTIDINDGRQSFGILNTFSFIQEGKNGRDSIDNIQHRAYGQMNALKGFLEFLYKNSGIIKKLIEDERQKLADDREGEKVVVRMEHVAGTKPEKMNMISIRNGLDTIVSVNNFHPVIKSLFEVEKPKGYLIPKSDEKLVGWLKGHAIKFQDAKLPIDSKIISYYIDSVKTENLEEMEINVPFTTSREINNLKAADFYYVPVNQLNSNFLVQCIEPSSMLGLAQYKYFSYLMEAGSNFPMLRVISRDK